MNSRMLSLRRGKTGDVQNFSRARTADDTTRRLLESTLGADLNAAHRRQILDDPSNVHQFACVFGSVVGFLTRPTMMVDDDGDTLVVGNFTDTIGEPMSVTVPLEDFVGSVTTLVPRGAATTFGLSIYPANPDTIGGPLPDDAVGPRRGVDPEPPEGSLERLHFPLGDDPTEADRPVIVALPLFLPVGPGQTFPHGLRLDDPRSFQEHFPLLDVWRAGMRYLRAQNGGRSVTVAGDLFYLPTFVPREGLDGHFAPYDIRTTATVTPALLTPTDHLFSRSRDVFQTWSNSIWVELGSAMEPEAPPVGGGGIGQFTPDHFRAAIEPLVKRDKTFESAGRTAARYRILLGGAPLATSTTPDQVVLPELLESFTEYLGKSSSATAGEDLRELVKSQLTVANASDLALDKDVTLEPENITLAFSDRVRTFSWLTEKLVSTSLAGAQGVLGFLQFLTPNREALAVVAEGDQEAVTLLMSNSTSNKAQLDASKASKMYVDGRLVSFKSSHEGFCNLRVLLSVMTEDIARPLLVQKLLEYTSLLVDRQGRLFFEAYQHYPHLAVHPWQDLQSILSAFTRVAANSALYGAVVRGEHVAYANYRPALDVADALINDLRAILNGNGLGKFEGTPSCAPWFAAVPALVASPGTPGAGKAARTRAADADGTPKRQKTLDPADIERRKGSGMLSYDAEVGGSRLPTLNVYAKKSGSKIPERICMKFCTQGYSCNNGPACKFPHVSSPAKLPEAERTKLTEAVKKAPGLSFSAGRGPTGTS